MLQRAWKKQRPKRRETHSGPSNLLFFLASTSVRSSTKGWTERKNVETHLGKFPFILAVAMIRIFFFLSLDGTNVTLRVYLTERREVSSRSEKRARATRARCETFFSQIEREKQPKNNQRGGRKPPSSLNSFLEKNVSHGRQRARKKHGPRATSRRVNPDFCERKPWMRFLFELNESPRAMVWIDEATGRARAWIFFCWKRTKEEERSLMSHIPVKIQISTFSFSSSSSSSRPSAWTALSRTRVNVLYKKMRRAFTTRSRVFVIDQ